MRTMSNKQRQAAVTFLVAGLAAIVGEHLLKPKLKRKLRVR